MTVPSAPPPLDRHHRDGEATPAKKNPAPLLAPQKKEVDNADALTTSSIYDYSSAAIPSLEKDSFGMFGLGVGEILLILAIALIFIGPEKLPDLARSLAKGYAEFRRSFDEVKNGLEKDMRSLHVEEHLREGKRNLEEIYKAPWAQEPGKLTPPGAAKVEEAEITTEPIEAATENSTDKKPVSAEQQNEH